MLGFQSCSYPGSASKKSGFYGMAQQVCHTYIRIKFGTRIMLNPESIVHVGILNISDPFRLKA